MIEPLSLIFVINRFYIRISCRLHWHATSGLDKVKRVKQHLIAKFNMTDLNERKLFLGMRLKESNKIRIDLKMVE